MDLSDLSGSGPPLGRRTFLSLLPLGLVALTARLSHLPADWLAPVEHPDPRPGIDGSRVLTADDLGSAPHVVDLFDAIREIPHIVDGIRCHCGCADLDGYRSLLSCYEKPGMAQWCEICQGEGRLAVRRVGEGQTLAEIRRAIDARYGHGGRARGHAESHAGSHAYGHAEDRCGGGQVHG